MTTRRCETAPYVFFSHLLRLLWKASSSTAAAEPAFN
jgi:hypothetical protein